MTMGRGNLGANMTHGAGFPGLTHDEIAIPESHVQRELQAYHELNRGMGPVRKDAFREPLNLTQLLHIIDVPHDKHLRGGFFPLALGALLPLLGSVASAVGPPLLAGTAGALGKLAVDKITGSGIVRRRRHPITGEPHFIVRGGAFKDWISRLVPLLKSLWHSEPVSRFRSSTHSAVVNAAHKAFEGIKEAGQAAAKRLGSRLVEGATNLVNRGRKRAVDKIRKGENKISRAIDRYLPTETAQAMPQVEPIEEYAHEDDGMDELPESVTPLGGAYRRKRRRLRHYY